MCFVCYRSFDYCSSIIKHRLNCQIAAIRLFEDNQILNGGWDYNIPFTNEIDFSQNLIDLLGEEKILSSSIFT